MGNLISSRAGPENELSGASTIIGFISFGFTLGTFVRVFWEELQTAVNASSEVHDALGNLKQALYEEQTHLRTVRRKCRSEYDSAAFRLLTDSIRHLIEQFKEIEQPFLSDAALEAQAGGAQFYSSVRQGGGPPAYSHPSYGQGHGGRRSRRHSYNEKHFPPGYDQFVEHDYDAFSDYFLTAGGYYRPLTIGLRFKWVRSRNKVLELATLLSRYQTRRIMRQVTDMAVSLKFVQQVLGGAGIGTARAAARRESRPPTQRERDLSRRGRDRGDRDRERERDRDRDRFRGDLDRDIQG